MTLSVTDTFAVAGIGTPIFFDTPKQNFSLQGTVPAGVATGYPFVEGTLDSINWVKVADPLPWGGSGVPPGASVIVNFSTAPVMGVRVHCQSTGSLTTTLLAVD